MGKTTTARDAVALDALLTPQELAAYVKVPLTTVYQWNSDRSGPRRCHVGKHVRYRKSDVDAWLDAKSTDGAA